MNYPDATFSVRRAGSDGLNIFLNEMVNLGVIKWGITGATILSIALVVTGIKINPLPDTV